MTQNMAALGISRGNSPTISVQRNRCRHTW